MKEGLYNLFVIILVSFDYFFNVICNPMLWFSMERSSKEATMIVNKLIQMYNENKIERVHISDCVVTFFLKDEESIGIWVRNYAYSYGNVYKTSFKYSNLRTDNVPSRYTKVLLHRFVRDLKRKMDKKQSREIRSLINSIDVDKVC